MPKINYVIATWSGSRRHGNDQHVADRTFYIREQLESLENLKHDLSQITIVVPRNPHEPEHLRDYLNNLPPTLGETPLVVIDRENRGQSYGSYSHVYGLYRDKFDYYIFIEDDYIFMEDRFDTILVSLFNSKKNCGFLCSLAKKFDKRQHAAISNGISSASSLEKVWEHHKGILPHGKSQEGYQTLPQLLFSWGFLDAGLTIEDITDDYDAPFNELGKMLIYGQGSKLTVRPRHDKNLIIPVQFKDKLKYKGDEKILIMLLYYERPLMVRNALESIKKINYDNWELVFIDDGSKKPGRLIVEEILADHLDKITFVMGDLLDKKIAQGGSRIGFFINSAIKQSDAEIGFLLCDDDTILPEYLKGLNRWFAGNPERMYCYSNVILYDPFLEKPDRDTFKKDTVSWQGYEMHRYKNRFNKKGRPVNPAGSLDSSQVAWRLSCNRKDGVWLSYPKTCHLDANFYRELNKRYGQAIYSGLTGQYKGQHFNNLALREEGTKRKASSHTNSIIFTVKDLDEGCDTP